MNEKTAKRLRRLAECSTQDRPVLPLYARAARVGKPGGLYTTVLAPFCRRGYYRHLKRLFK